jgi:hypothetical protein
MEAKRNMAEMTNVFFVKKPYSRRDWSFQVGGFR